MSNLTDRMIQSLRPPKGERLTASDDKVRGLSIFASYGGTKTFYFRYKTPEGRQKRVRIGGYPHTSLRGARRKVREYKAKMDDGVDLAATLRQESLTDREIHTIGQLWAEYYIDAIPRKKSAHFEAQLWDKHIAKSMNELDVRSFTRDIILDFLLPFRRANSPALGARIQAILSQLGAYAVERRVLEHSPAYQLGKKKPLPTCDRHLNSFELSKLWGDLSNQNILEEATVSPSLANAIKLCLCTCARRGEVAGMQWSEIDIHSRVWTIPGARTKNKRPHIVPLADISIAILRDAKANARRPNSRFVFPGRRTEAKTKGPGHIRGDSVTRACSRLHQILDAAHGIEKFTPHDLRRTAATFMASRLKIDRFIISQVLNHSSDKGGGAAVTSVYARYDYMEEKRHAITAWTDFLFENEKNAL